MNTLRELLQQADPAGPLNHEPGLSTADVQAMRRAVLRAAVQPAPRPAWPGALAVAAVVVVMVLAGAAAGRRLPPRETVPQQEAGAAGALSEEERRQVQFATPGGTRIIWTIDPNFHIREVMP